MGCDGGTIAGRKDMVQTKKRVISAHSIKSQARSQVNTCALSQTPLRAPVVACAMGLLFNKDAVIEYLLAKQSFAHFSHITSLKDVVPVTLHWNQSAVSKLKSNSSGSASAAAAAASSTEETTHSTDPNTEEESLYTCPITGVPSNGVNRFVALQPCGCVISERAMKSVAAGADKGKIDTCMVCSKNIGSDQVLAPTSLASMTGADGAAASSAAVAAQSSVATAAAASAVTNGSASASPFHHPSYITLFPGGEETLYLRGIVADRIKAKEAEKAAKKAAKKHEKGNNITPHANTSVSGESVAGHKRKADNDEIGSSSSKRSAVSVGNHTSLVHSRTGNILADTVASITRQAAESVAQRRKDAKFDRIFLTQQQIDATRYDSISTKPASCMALL
jgi:hypothetical protein